MKNSNDTIGNRNRGLPVCSAVPQPTAPQRVPNKNRTQKKWSQIKCSLLLNISPIPVKNTRLQVFFCLLVTLTHQKFFDEQVKNIFL